MKVKAEFIYPPIPDRRFDWSAVDDETYEPGGPIGWGRTKGEAILDLFNCLQDRESPPT